LLASGTAGRAPSDASRETIPATAVPSPAAAPGRGGFSGARSGDATKVGETVAVGFTAPADRTAARDVGRGNGQSPSAGGAPAWSAVLLDASSTMGPVPAPTAGALRPEMPAHGGADVLLGGAGDDLLVGGEGRDLLVGGYALTGPRAEHDARCPLWLDDPDAYFIRMSQDDEGSGPVTPIVSGDGEGP
jgi:hypothetical protein